MTEAEESLGTQAVLLIGELGLEINKPSEVVRFVEAVKRVAKNYHTNVLTESN